MADYFQQLLADMANEPASAGASPAAAPQEDYFSRALNDVAAEQERTAGLQATRQEALKRNQGGISRELESGWEQTKGSVARTVGEFTGWQGAKDYADERAAEASGLSEGSGFTQSWDEVDGIGSAASYAAKATLNTIPGVAAMALPGAAAYKGAQAAKFGIDAARNIGLATAFASNAAQQTGGNLDAQIEEGQEVDLFSAGAAGVAQAGLDTFTGVGGQVLSRLRKPATEVATEVAKGGLKAFGKRTLRTAAEEAVTEGAQQVLQEAARAQVTPEGEEFDMNAALKRVKENAITGALVGGALGGSLSVFDRSKRVAPATTADEASTGATPAQPEEQVPSQEDRVKEFARTASNDEFSVALQNIKDPAERERLISLRSGGALAAPAPVERDIAGDFARTASNEEFSAALKNVTDPAQRDALMRARASGALPAPPDLLSVFTGATPETLRPVEDGTALRIIRGDLPANQIVVSLASKLNKVFAGAPLRGRKAMPLPVAERIALAKQALDDAEMDLAANPRIKSVRQKDYLAAIQRGRDLVAAYELGIEQLSTQPDPTANRTTAGAEGFVAPSPERLEAERLAQATVDAKVMEQQALAQQQAEQQRAEQLGILEAAAPQAEQIAKTVEEQQAMQQEDNLRIQQEQLQPAQRQELLDSIINGAKPNVTPLQSFLKGLKQISPEAQPTPEELNALAQYTSMSYADKVKAAEKVKPEKLVPKAPQNEGLLEPVSVPPKMSKRQQRAMQARAEATARVPENQQPPEIKSMLKALEDAATSIDATFKSLLNAAPAAQQEQLSMFEGPDPRLQPGQRKGFQQIVRNRIGPEDAKFEKQLAELKEALAKVEAEQAAAKAKADAEFEAAQGKLFTAQKQPTKQAQRLTKDQVAERVYEMSKRFPPTANGAAMKYVVMPEVEALVETAPGETVVDLMNILTQFNPDEQGVMQKAEMLIQVTKDRYAPKAQAAPVQETAAQETPAAEEAAPAVLDEEYEGINPGDVQLRPRSGRGDIPVTSTLQKQIDAIVSGWKNAPKVVAFNPYSPKPGVEEALAQEIESGVDFMGIYHVPTQTIYIPTTARLSPDDLRGTIYHEALGHFGLKVAFGKELNRLLDNIYQGNPDVRQEVARRIKRGDFSSFDPTSPNAELDERRYHVEEILVERFNAGDMELKQGWVSRIRDMITNFARRMGLPARKFTNAEIGAILKKARDAVVQGQPTPPRGPRKEFGIRARVAKDAESQSRAILRAAEKYGIPDALTSVAITANDLRLRAQMGLMFGRDLVDYAKGFGINSYERYFNTLQEVQAVSRGYITQMDQIMVGATRLPKGQKAELNKFLKAHTLGKKWGYQPTWDKAPAVTVDPTAEKQWNDFKAANPEAAALADRIFEYGYKSRRDLQDAVKNHIEKETAGDIANALTPAEKKKIEQRKARQINMFNKMVPMIEGPYAPLSRFGNYAAVAKSAEFRAAEAAWEADKGNKELRAELDRLRVDGDHYIVSFHDSLGEAEIQAKVYDNLPTFKGTKADAMERTTAFEQIGDPPLLQMQKLKDMIHGELGETDKFGRDTAKAITELVRDLYVKSLAETSARKHDVYRQGIAGADDDMLRAFAQKGRSDANFLGQIKGQYEMGEILQTIIKEGNVKDGLRADRKRLVGEITRRHAASMQPDNTPWQDKAMAISSFFHLATSPRYYIMNAMQTFMFSAPVMAGRYGVGAYQSLASTYYELMPTFTKAGFWRGEVDLDKLGLKDENEITALKRMQTLGLLEAGMQYDAGYWEATGDGSASLVRANHMFRTVSGQVEFVNRVTAGLTAYRLEMARSKNTETATKQMQDIIAQTQFDYSRSNAPSFFNALPKVMTQFKKYQLGQIALQGRLIYNAVQATDPKERAVARKTIGYMYSQLTLVAGAAGIPAMQLIGVIAAAIFGDDDKPLDGEEFIESLVGKGVYRGVPSELGFEMSGLGLGAILNPFPFVDYKELTTREGLQENVLSFIGPIAGVAEKQVRAYEAAQSGEWLRAVGEALPSGITGAVRAYELATRGLEKKNGDMLMEPDALQALIRAVGFTPSEVRDAQIANARKVAHEEYFQGRQSQLTRAYTQAVKAKDEAARTQIIEQWRNLQVAKDRAGFKATPLTNLLRAPQQQAKREKNTVKGVQVNNSNRRFVEAATE